MPKYIVSQPAITLCIESRSSRSPTTTSAPMSRNACARSSSFRAIARTAFPCFNSSSVTVRPIPPTRPAAPVTRMGFMLFPPIIPFRHGSQYQNARLPGSVADRVGGGRRRRRRLVEQLPLLRSDDVLQGGLDKRKVRVVRRHCLRERGELRPLPAKLLDLPR